MKRELSDKFEYNSGTKGRGDWIVPDPVHFVKQMSSNVNIWKGKDPKERKTVVYNNLPTQISFQYLPFSTQPNQLKIADFGVSK